MKLLQSVYAICFCLALAPWQANAHFASPLQKDNRNTAPPTNVPVQKQNTSELLTLLLAAEIALQRNLATQALEKYLLATQLTLDPKIAKRATELAVELQQAEAAKIASQIWANHAQDDLQAQMVAITLLIGTSKVEAKPYIERIFDKKHPDLDQYFMGVLLKLSPHSKAQLTESLNDIAMQRSDDQMALLIAAQASALAGDVDHAKKWVSKILQKEPGNTIALQLRAKIIRFETRNDQKALNFLAEKIKVYPKNSKLRSFYINALLDNKKTQKAIAELKLLSQDKIFSSEALLSLSQIYLQKNKFDSSEKILKQVEKDPENHYTARFFLGQLFEKKQRYPEAIQWYRKVAEGRHHVLAQLRVAELLSVLLFQHKEALTTLKNIQPQNLSDQKKIALTSIYILKRHNQPEQAMKTANYFLKELPGDLELLYARAMVASVLQKIKIVEQDLRIILTLNPNHANALNILGFTLANQTTRFDEARAYLERAIALNPDHPAYLDSLGWLEYREGNLEQALIHLKKAASLSDNPVVATHLGEVLWRLQQRKQAQTVWKQALEKHPAHKLLQKTLKRLKVVLN